ncbi:MAG: helix-turn-helix domain-containing protein [Aquaticitalea sp.]
MNSLDGFMIQEGQYKNGQFFDGIIEKSILNNNVEFYRFRLNSKGRFNIIFNSPECGILSFINMNDKKNLSFKNHGQLHVVSPFSSAIINCATNIDIQCIFEADVTYNFVIIRSEHSNLKCGNINLLEKIASETDDLQSNFVRAGVPNLVICDTVKNLLGLDMDMSESKLIAFGYCNIIFGLLCQEKKLKENSYLNTNFFRSNEIKQLELLTSEIQQNPERQFSLTDLCKKTGMSITKLQAGFKEMHNCTVAIFIRDIRLAKAIELLQQTDLNVSEIVFSVGLNSRSYFCRIFKQRFKCSPKSYQQRIRTTMSTAS